MSKRNELLLSALIIGFLIFLLAVIGWGAGKQESVLGGGSCDKIKSIETKEGVRVEAFTRTNDKLNCGNLKEYLVSEVRKGNLTPAVDIATISTEEIAEALVIIAEEEGIQFQIFQLR